MEVFSRLFYTEQDFVNSRKKLLNTGKNILKYIIHFIGNFIKADDYIRSRAFSGRSHG